MILAPIQQDTSDGKREYASDLWDCGNQSYFIDASVSHICDNEMQSVA